MLMTNATLPVPPSSRRLPIPDLAPEGERGTTIVNGRVIVRDDPAVDWRVVLVSGIPLVSYGRGDKHSERLACVKLHLDGFASQSEIAAAFGVDRVTLYRWERRYLKKGLAGLLPYRPKGRPRSIPSRLEDAIVRLHGMGLGITRLAARLGISVGVVRGVYRRRGLVAHEYGTQGALFSAPGAPDGGVALAAAAEGGQEVGGGDPSADQGEETAPAPTSADSPAEAEGDADRSVGVGEQGAGESAGDDGPLACWDGLLTPNFESARGVIRAGVLLALPVLKRLQVFKVVARLYASCFGVPTGYGLLPTVTFLVFMALWRIKRPEQLKTFSPEELGRVLGLPRAPEVKTVRRKLEQMANRYLARELMAELAKVRIKEQDDLVGTLYVDGHVRPYSGRYDLAKGYSTQRHMPVRATTDTWANDRNGDPLFVVTSEINEHLTQTLPEVLAEAQQLVGPQRPITAVFDRGGWSPTLFVRLIEAGFQIITYQKGRLVDLPVKAFEKRSFEVGEETLTYHLHDEHEVRISKEALSWEQGEPRPLVMRQITKLTPQTGHQTAVVTTRTDLAAEQVLWRMFARWRQENFFKYMREQFAIDALVEHGCERVDPALDRPNPEREALGREIDVLRARVGRLQSQRCELIPEETKRSPDPPGFERFVPEKLRQKKLLEQIRPLKQALAELEQRRAELPERVSAGDLQRLPTERKLLMDCFKIVAYQVETELARMAAPCYERSEDEGRKLIAAALCSTADYEVSRDELRVTLHPQSSPHRTRAIAALCSNLNRLGAVFPESNLRVVLASAPDDTPRPVPNVAPSR